MGYIKIIQTGNLIERYEYQKEVIPDPRFGRHNKRDRHFKPYRRASSVFRARVAFLRLVQANLLRPEVPSLLTLTFKGVVGLKEAWREYTLFAQRLRNKIPSAVLLTVAEFQKRGAVHFHSLVWGLGDLYVSERQTRYLANIWRSGFLDIIRTNGSPSLGGYLAKYLVKSYLDQRFQGFKLYSGSRSLFRPVTFRSKLQTDFIGEMLENATCQKSVSYDTKWLGRCDYQKYIL